MSSRCCICILILLSYLIIGDGFVKNRNLQVTRQHQRSGLMTSDSSTANLEKDDSSRLVKHYINYLDLFRVVQLAFTEFSPTCQGDAVKQVLLFLDILAVYAPKLLLPQSIMGHSVIGLKFDDRVVAMGDLSLQSSSGSLNALDRTLLAYRRKKYEILAPYMCNFMVKKEFRRKGFGKVLMKCIEDDVSKMGFSELFLHVDGKSFAAIAFYLSLGFQPVRRLEEGVIFMKKTIKSQS